VGTHVFNTLSSTVLVRPHELKLKTWVPTFFVKPMNLTQIRTSVPTFLVCPTNFCQFLVVPPRSSNSVESHGASPRASGAPLPAPLGRSPPSPLTSFRSKQRGPRSLRYMVVAMTQTRLSRSRKTLAPLGTISTSHARAEGLCGFFRLTQLTRIHLEQALMRSN
jgi:hypothetical protein